MRESWDAIVIGSGIGGLTVAGLLARTAGMKVLVLEKHLERGGQTHTFRRDGASWDVGLHYVGNLKPHALERRLFDFLSGGALQWNRMPKEFERFIYPDLEFSVPANPQEYEQRLVERFPDEAAAICNYFRDLRAAARWYVLGIQQQMMPAPLNLVLALYRRFGLTRATQTVQAYLDGHFQAPELKALLATQWGDYGLPPKEGAFAIHALVVGSYFRGGWFPRGGAGRIARTFEQGIEAAGGAIRVGQEVTEIILENGRAAGVAVRDLRGSEVKQIRYEAPLVISDAGARVTYEHLLPTAGAIGRRTRKARAFIASLTGGLSAVTLYLRLKAPVSSLGVEGENYWINTDFDHNDPASHSKKVLTADPGHIYLSFPSAKSGDDRFHTAEIITMVQPQVFARWRDTNIGQRGADYAALKERIAQGLLRTADRALPGLAALVQYYELSTPLTVEHYTAHPDGCFYGLPAIPARYRGAGLSVRTPIAGLYLTGSDVASPGVAGAMMGGLAAASRIMGARGLPRIMAAIAREPKMSLAPGPASRNRARLVAKKALTPSIWELKFELDESVAFEPGQYAKLQVAPFEWRDYSIAALSDRQLTLLVSNRTHGEGSHYADTATPGMMTEIELPLGSYRLKQNAGRKIFVATGTGLAPFLPMFEALEKADGLDTAELYFGCRTQAEDITAAFAVLPRTIACVSRQAPPAGGFGGRVSDALRTLSFDPATTDVYVCGSAAMVADCRAILERKGAARILTEAY
ncbi:MAG: FAD-dependent oxidoreductase [Rhizomicrobium sp.]